MKSAASHSPLSDAATSRSGCAIDAKASEWVTQRRAGLTAKEENELAEWISADAAHSEAFQRLEPWRVRCSACACRDCEGVSVKFNRVYASEYRRPNGSLLLRMTTW